MNLLEAVVQCYRDAQQAYYFHRGMMNSFWPNPYKEIPEENYFYYDYHRAQVKKIHRALSEMGLPLYPRKALK